MRKNVTVNAQILWISSYRHRRGWICRARISQGMAIRFSCQRLEYRYHGWRRASDAGSPRSYHGQRTVYSRDGEPDRAPVARSYRAWGDRVPFETLHAGGVALGVSALSGAEGVRRGQRDSFESASERSVATKIVPRLRDKPVRLPRSAALISPNWL